MIGIKDQYFGTEIEMKMCIRDRYWREDILVQRRISPEITTSTVIAWRRNIPYSLAVRKMIEEINAFQA